MGLDRAVMNGVLDFFIVFVAVALFAHCVTAVLAHKPKVIPPTESAAGVYQRLASEARAQARVWRDMGAEDLAAIEDHHAFLYQDMCGQAQAEVKRPISSLSRWPDYFTVECAAKGCPRHVHAEGSLWCEFHVNGSACGRRVHRDGSRRCADHVNGSR